MALGIKFKTLVTQNGYSLEELYEAINNREFTAGKPELAKMGFNNIIVFPPLDRQNQIWIIPKQMKNCKKWQISKQGIAGVGNAIVNIAFNEVTGGLFGLGGMFGKKTNRTEELVDITLKEFEALRL